MKNIFTAIGFAVLALASFIATAFILNFAGLASFSFFAPKVEQVRFDTFKQSQAYNDGMLRDLQNLKLEYLRSNPEQQAALKAIVIQRFSVYPIDRLPPDLQAFYLSAQGK